jgi:hypothetical protein
MTTDKFAYYPICVKVYTTDDLAFIIEFCGDKTGNKTGDGDTSAAFALSSKTAIDLAEAILKLSIRDSDSATLH